MPKPIKKVVEETAPQKKYYVLKKIFCEYDLIMDEIDGETEQAKLERAVKMVNDLRIHSRVPKADMVLEESP